MCMLLHQADWKTESSEKRLQNSNHYTSLQCCCSQHPLIWMWNIGRLPSQYSKVLEQFQHHILRAILGVHWQDRKTNVRILEQANTTSRHTWSDHRRAGPDMWDACQIPEYRKTYCTASFHMASGKPVDSGNARKTNWKPNWRGVKWPSNGKPEPMTRFTGDVRRAWVHTLSGGGSPWMLWREKGETTKNKTTTTTLVGYAVKRARERERDV